MPSAPTTAVGHTNRGAAIPTTPQTKALASYGRRCACDSRDISAVAATLFQWAKSQPDLAVLPAVERELVAHALRETNGNQVQASKLLGITRATLRKRIDKFGIKQAVSVE